MKLENMLFVSGVMFALVSCQPSPRSKEKTANNEVDSTSTVLQPETAKYITLRSQWDSVSLDKKGGKMDTIKVNVSSYNGIAAKITPSKPGNIRFNLIILPNGETDGPFGKTLDYKVTEPGIYSIVIGESLMQGDRFAGQYQLKFQGRN